MILLQVVLLAHGSEGVASPGAPGSPVVAIQPPAPDGLSPAIFNPLSASLSVTEKGAEVSAAAVLTRLMVPKGGRGPRVALSGRTKSDGTWAAGLSFGGGASDARLVPSSFNARIIDECDQRGWKDLAKRMTSVAEAVGANLGNPETSQELVKSGIKMLNGAGLSGALKEEFDAIADRTGEAGDAESACRAELGIEYIASEAFSGVFGVSVDIGLNGWPVSIEPRVVGEGDVLVDPAARWFRGGDLGISGTWHPSSTNLVAMKLAWTYSFDGRGTTDQISTLSGGSVTYAHAFPFGVVDKKTVFRPRVVFGGSLGAQLCSSGKCGQDFSSLYGDEAKALDMEVSISTTPFLDVLASSKVQLRVGIPWTVRVLDDHPPGTPSGTVLHDIRPTLSLGVSTWKLSG